MTDDRIKADLQFMEARALLQQAYARICAGNDFLRGEPEIELIAELTKDLLDTTLRNLGITRRHIEKATGKPRAVKAAAANIKALT
jgi:hypothetical protein